MAPEVNAVGDPAGPASNEAQRDLERRALRNVRSLVDNLENRDRMDGRRSLRLLAKVLAATALAMGLGYVAVRTLAPPGTTREITTAVPKPGEGPRVTPR
jgi:hypothetical protein